METSQAKAALGVQRSTPNGGGAVQETRRGQLEEDATQALPPSTPSFGDSSGDQKYFDAARRVEVPGRSAPHHPRRPRASTFWSPDFATFESNDLQTSPDS